ncbi:lymphoid-specific helicase [Lasioglossum baleicum]|uniref:lymphoid-specific helicase n=1 Tax=Lasioglossum baleicum TaxID=434251 RepID=UPI003FCCD5DD
MEANKENVNTDILNNPGITTITSTIGLDVKFSNEPLNSNIENDRKRKRRNDEAKLIAKEQYIQEMQEQQYKRLMHLLNRSKFFSNYIVDKIDGTMKKKKRNKTVTAGTKKVENRGGKTSLEDKKTKGQEKRNRIDKNVQKQIQKQLSQEDNENELINDDDNDKNNAENDIDFEMPKYFDGDLRDYQKDGLQWLKVLYENGINGILADEMGLGKTIQVIALLCHLFEKQQSGPYLIVAPLSTIPNWTAEFNRFAPELPVTVLYGTANERLIVQKKIAQKHKVADCYSSQPIVLTTFEVPIKDKHFLRSQHWRYIIIDEGHRIKKYNCQLVRVLATCKSMNRLLLTGTPLQNNLAELWSLLNFLLPEIFDNLAVFESWFDAKELQYDEGTKKFLKLEQEKHVLASLREILKPFMLRREKADVCLDIPPKKELIVYTPLTELQYNLYKAVLDRDIRMLSKIREEPSIYTDEGIRRKRRCVLRNMPNNKHELNNDTEKKSVQDSLRKKNDANYDKLQMWKQYTDVTERNQDFLLNITFLQQVVMYKKIVNHPYLVHCPLDPCGLPLIDENLIKSSGKLLVLDLMLAKLKSQGHKVLLFSTMTTILDKIEDYLSMRPYEYVRLDGQIKFEERKTSIENFNSDPNIFLFLLSTRAGGVGLNLAAADTVIIYDSDWNPQMDIQAMARCHRIGQTKPIVVYRLCAKGTIDEIIIKRADAKRVLEKMVIPKTAKVVLNKDTLLELQKYIKSNDYQVVASKNEAFTEEELDKIMDRSDLMENLKPKEP